MEDPTRYPGRGAVANWEADKGIKSQNQIAIAQLSGASIEWLVMARGDAPDRTALEAIGRRFKPEIVRAVPVVGRARFEETVPVLGAAAGAMTALSGSFSFGDDAPVGYAPMMPGLTGERDVYALFVEETSMMPMYPPRSLVYVSPHRPPHRDDTVIVQEPHSANGRPQTFIKLYERETPRQLFTRQLNPDSSVIFEKKRGILVHRVYPLRELAGI